MIVVIKRGSPTSEVDNLVKSLENMGFECHRSEGKETEIIGLIGDTSHIDIDFLGANEVVQTVKRVSEPFKAANRKFHPNDTIIKVANKKLNKTIQIGGGSFALIAGPCSVESEEQIVSVAKSVQQSGASMLRGGAFKPRTSPYAFQGLHAEGLELLLIAKQETGLPIVTEIMDLSQLDLFRDVDIIQVGARNMQNFTLLRELGKCGKPILLKRGLSSTIEEWLMSAEYIFAGGNSDVILCERGIRTFETQTRNTFDISAIPVLKKLSHLPIIVDPSHATGIPELVKPLTKASVAAGADGAMIEVHNNPKCALCDGAQSLTPAQYDDVVVSLKGYLDLENKFIS